MLNPNPTGTATTTELLTDLVYELLDAHCDTICLAGNAGDGDEWPAHVAGDAGDGDVWAAHLDYLRDLQRVGREALARVPSPTPAG
jgi:hypothetical protein